MKNSSLSLYTKISYQAAYYRLINLSRFNAKANNCAICSSSNANRISKEYIVQGNNRNSRLQHTYLIEQTCKRTTTSPLLEWQYNRPIHLPVYLPTPPTASIANYSLMCIHATCVFMTESFCGNIQKVYFSYIR